MGLLAARELKVAGTLCPEESQVLKQLVFLRDDRVLAAVELFDANSDTADMLDTLTRVARFEYKEMLPK